MSQYAQAAHRSGSEPDRGRRRGAWARARRSLALATVVTLLSVLGSGAAVSLWWGCGTPPRAASSSAQPETDPPPTDCPARQDAPALLPAVAAEHRQLDYWLSRDGAGLDLDDELLSVADIASHNAAFAAQRGRPLLTHADLLAPESRSELLEELNERLAFMRGRIASGKYRDEHGKVLAGEQQRALASLSSLPELELELRVALAEIPLRCGPVPMGLYQLPELDHAFDRNNCSTIRPQEPLRLLARWRGGMWLVRTGYSLGFIAADVALSPPVPAELASGLVDGERLSMWAAVTLQGKAGRSQKLADKTRVARATGDGLRALFATEEGFDESQELTGEQARSTRRALTRRALLTEAFRYLDTPYGWGGQEGGRDCSRFVMDVLAAFGLRLPRHSSDQARAGSMRIDLGEVSSEGERLAILDAAWRQGVVLLHFPGHIMLYLGRAAGGRPMAIHSFAEYRMPCAKPAADGGIAETLFRVDRVQISDLNLGKGSSKGSFLERTTHLTLFARRPGPALLGAVERRPAAPLQEPFAKACTDSDEVALLVSPRQPSSRGSVRVIVSSARDLGSTRLVLFAPDGRQHEPELHRLGGPPFGYWVELAKPVEGRWRARVGEGAQVAGCVSFRVRDRGPQRQAGEGAVWRPRRRWTDATENLYATFVEQLFDYPPQEDRTWTNLQGLLGERTKNILYDHLGQDEDRRLRLQPDCADLPYFLRAYFAWKLRLPFGYRKCNRGTAERAPYCDPEVLGHLDDRAEPDEVQAFAHFARRNVADGVHSGNGRTPPGDERSDYYPLPLSRRALRPGTVFADPYGHVLVVADWVPQTATRYGVLIGADAQPDGTIGRRRFWRGSFLFSPDTALAGAGFKAFRPLRVRGGRLRPVQNADIGPKAALTPFSEQQYEGTAVQFYERMEALINPRPLEPKALLGALLDALEESVARRVISVQNGETYHRSHRQVIDMPRGHRIFETTGPWEDYSTPSRDMRLLIAIDTVVGFPDRVERSPERFGLPPLIPVEVSVAQLRAHLALELARRRVVYQRSDGARFELSLQQVVGRAAAFEMAYNPNDCVEIRWAAPEGSDERSTCQRHAPAEQRQRMEQYRSWFAKRQRPAR